MPIFITVGLIKFYALTTKSIISNNRRIFNKRYLDPIRFAHSLSKKYLEITAETLIRLIPFFLEV